MASSKQTAGGHQHWHMSSIQVQAFKSFAAGSTFNVPTPHLAGIVGPNGCGKSNLLEAICFAAAGSTGVLRLTGRSLADVTSTDAGSQRPEVRLHITKGRTTHVLEACLTPEGGRSYKIDGKLKTGTQVKDFLKARGIVIDSTTVIQQAAVTGLSDSNNAMTLAQLVAGASGLSSWNQETAAARQEVARTHKALKDIQSNIDKVQSSVAAEDAALKAAAEAAQLEQQLEQQVQELLRGLQLRQGLLEQELQDRQQEEQRLEAADAAYAEQQQHQAAQRKALTTQQAAILSQLNNASSDHDSTASSSSGSLCKQVAAAEAQVASVQTAIATRAQWAADLQQKQQLQQQQNAQCELLQQRLAAKQAEAAGIRANLAAVKSGSDAAAALQQQTQDAAAASAAVQQQEKLLAAKQQEVQHADSKAQFLLQQWQASAQPAKPTSQHAHSQPDQATAALPATTARTDYIITSATAAASAAASAAESHMQQLQGLQQQHMRLQMQAQAAERTLTPAATAGLLAQLGSSCSTLPLHACFRLKDTASAGAAATSPQQLEQLLTPLSVIAGPAVLQTLVAPSVSEANRLLAAAAAGAGGAAGSNRRLKIWPLDNLSVHDLQRQQRAAQQQLGQHAVLLPLDLLEFEAGHRPALLRAFGGYVIAADDATAAVLVERYGLSAVTLQGTVSRKGSMTGGWTGSSGSTARIFWTNKHRHDQTQRQLTACRQQLSEAEGRAQALQQQRAAAEAAFAAAQQRRQLLGELLEAQAEAAAAAVAREQQQQVLTELQDRAAGLQQRLQQYKVAFGEGADGRGGSSSSRSSSASGAAGGKAASVLLQQQLQAEADKATAAAAAAEQQLEQAQEQAEELSASIEALEVRLAGAQDPQQQEAALQACLQDLHQLRQQQATEAAAGEALQEQLRRLQQQQEQLEQQVKTAVQEQKAVQKQVAQAVQAVKGAAAALQKLGVQRKQALRDFNGTDAVHAFSGSAALKDPAAAAAAAAADGAAASSEGAVPTEGQLQQLGRRARQLQGKLSRLDVPQLLPGQKEALTARLGQAAEFKAQADALKAAAAGLEGQVTSDAEQVYAANDVVFEDVAAGFSQLCSSLLPSLELQLVRVASQAHEGLQFRFRRLQDEAAAAAAADAVDDASWHCNLGQLSGGQRTLVSLAMLLAVARAGGTCGLLLLDEIDAALDEFNQARVSALLRQLAHDRASACQVLCVTHNAGFQGSCDGFVRVTKSAAGHSVPADTEQQQQEAVRPAAGAAGGGKAGRKGVKQGKGPAAPGGTGKAKRVRFSVGG